MARRTPRRNSKGRFVKGSGGHKRRRKSNPRRARRRVHVAHVTRRRRRRHVRAAAPRRRRRRFSVARIFSRRRRRSNPRFSLAGITHQLIPAAYGAGGAIALDLAIGYLPLPAMLQTGYPKHATRIVGALGIGWLAQKFLKGKGTAVAQGALTVALYSLIKDVVVQVAPSVKGLGDYAEVTMNTANLGAYMDPAARLGAYLPDGSSAPAGAAPGMGAYLAGEEMFGLDY